MSVGLMPPVLALDGRGRKEMITALKRALLWITLSGLRTGMRNQYSFVSWIDVQIGPEGLIHHPHLVAGSLFKSF